MKPLPFPVRIAAGLVATAVEQARDLPRLVVEFPVTAVSQALQASMRVQQKVTELAIKGDKALGVFGQAPEAPAWATFDEDLDQNRYDMSRPSAFDRATEEPSPNGHELDLDGAPDPWTLEEQALEEATEATAYDGEPAGPAGVHGYDELSLPQLRARLRKFTVDELTELLDYERAHANRPAFVGMLSRRIATVRDVP